MPYIFEHCKRCDYVNSCYKSGPDGLPDYIDPTCAAGPVTKDDYPDGTDIEEMRCAAYDASK